MNGKTNNFSSSLNGHVPEFLNAKNDLGMHRYGGRPFYRMGKISLLLFVPFGFCMYAFLLYSHRTDVRKNGNEMTVGFYDRLDLTPIQMPQDIWYSAISDYEKFPEIVAAVEKHYTPTCEARCSGYSSEVLNLIRQGECLHLWPHVYVLDTETNAKTENNSTASLPCFLSLGTSRIKNAGRGIFSEIDLPPGLLFGPYKGYIVYEDKKISAYAWQVYERNNASSYYYVDAGSPSSSNWMRYVNSARFEEEQNIFPFPIEEDVYYLTYKRIPAKSELLTWYGPNYAKTLGMKVKDGKEEKYPLIAPFRKDFVVIND